MNHFDVVCEFETDSWPGFDNIHFIKCSYICPCCDLDKTHNIRINEYSSSKTTFLSLSTCKNNSNSKKIYTPDDRGKEKIKKFIASKLSGIWEWWKSKSFVIIKVQHIDDDSIV
jgi:hypothetical protein